MVIPSTSRKEQVLKLIEQKDKIEQTINDCGRVLAANGNVGMTESLVDDFGFPRNDIDVYQVRTARNQIVCLQNDLKALLKEIEQGLGEVHAEAKVNHEASTKMSQMDISPSEVEPSAPSKERDASSHVAIVKVNFVSAGSPAETAGLKADDEIIEFGSVNVSNFNDLKQIGEVVMHRQSQQIALKIRRRNAVHELTLIPKTWSGRGLLGCNIVLANNTAER